MPLELLNDIDDHSTNEDDNDIPNSINNNDPNEEDDNDVINDDDDKIHETITPSSSSPMPTLEKVKTKEKWKQINVSYRFKNQLPK